jgi:uncharacterized protein YbjT (DUF2867 family)
LRVMVTGASGLIGSAITARLISAGHNVFGLARNVKEDARRWTDAQWRTCDIARMTLRQLSGGLPAPQQRTGRWLVIRRVRFQAPRLRLVRRAERKQDEAETDGYLGNVG